jgi:hypothetical protein
MKLLEMPLEQILVDTLEYYNGHPERICGTESKCAYNPATIGKEEATEGCAIGRLIDTELATILDEENTSISTQGTIKDIRDYSEPLYNKIKENLSFFSELQVLHDKGEIAKFPLQYGTKEILQNLIKKYNFNPELFTKWLSND